LFRILLIITLGTIDWADQCWFLDTADSFHTH
jgi:hypothetical protein